MSLLGDQKTIEKYFLSVEKEYEREMAKIFRDAVNEIRIEMAKIYEKYSVNGVLTNAQMTQYNRLITLQKSILEIMKPAARAAIKIVDTLKPEEYGEAFFRNAWAFDNATGVGLKWGSLDKNAIAASLDNPFFDSAKKSFWFNVNNRIPGAISNGLAIGQSYPDMIRDLKDMVNKDNFEIMRVLRTELHASQESGTMAAYDAAEEMGIEGRAVWIATLDGRTRDTHQEMDGVERDKDGYFHGAITAEYPGDPGLPAGERCNCRCDIRYEVDGFSPAIRRSREDGVIPYQTYRDWAEDRTLFK